MSTWDGPDDNDGASGSESESYAVAMLRSAAYRKSSGSSSRTNVGELFIEPCLS